MFNAVLKKAMPAIFWTAGLFVAGVCLLVFLVVANQWSKDRDYEAELRPSIEWVESFERSKHRLPSDAEFAARSSAQSARMIDLLQSDSAEPAFKSHGGGQSKSDFAVRIWRGEQWTVYFSWNETFDIVEP